MTCVTVSIELSPPINVRNNTPFVQNVSNVFGDVLSAKKNTEQTILKCKKSKIHMLRAQCRKCVLNSVKRLHSFKVKKKGCKNGFI